MPQYTIQGVSMIFISLIILGIALSMDAFSLSILFGSIRTNHKIVYKLSIMVGLCHVVMTSLGLLLGHLLEHYYTFSTKPVIFFIFFLLGIIMIVHSLKEEGKSFATTNIGLLLMAIGVSLDSFAVGVGSTFITEHHVISPVIFGILSGIFTYIGLRLGAYISTKLSYSFEMIGGIIFVLYAFFSVST